MPGRSCAWAEKPAGNLRVIPLLPAPNFSMLVAEAVHAYSEDSWADSMPSIREKERLIDD